MSLRSSSVADPISRYQHSRSTEHQTAGSRRQVHSLCDFFECHINEFIAESATMRTPHTWLRCWTEWEGLRKMKEKAIDENVWEGEINREDGASFFFLTFCRISREIASLLQSHQGVTLPKHVHQQLEELIDENQRYLEVSHSEKMFFPSFLNSIPSANRSVTSLHPTGGRCVSRSRDSCETDRGRRGWMCHRTLAVRWREWRQWEARECSEGEDGGVGYGGVLLIHFGRSWLSHEFSCVIRSFVLLPLLWVSSLMAVFFGLVSILREVLEVIFPTEQIIGRQMRKEKI